MKKEYSSPMLTVVTFHNERGFALSGEPFTTQLEMLFSQQDGEYRETETFSTHSTWTESNSSGFWQ